MTCPFNNRPCPVYNPGDDDADYHCPFANHDQRKCSIVQMCWDVEAVRKDLRSMRNDLRTVRKDLCDLIDGLQYSKVMSLKPKD